MITNSIIPNNPGCYLFKDKSKRIIYIGKAKDLKKRVKSYFQKKDHDQKTLNLVKNIDSVDFILTNNEIEAFILENNLIKKNRPKYNIDLKDSKRYAYIKLTDEDYPVFLIERKKEGSGEFFGPFVSAATRDHLISTLKRTFSLRTCKKMKKKPCLREHIKLCCAPCTKKITKEEYKKRIENAKLILKGKTSSLINKLNEEMKKESKKLNFEKALELKNQIESLEYLKERQIMERKREYNEDIINYSIKNEKAYLILFNIYKGILENKQEFVFDHKKDFFEEFLVQYYSENKIPKEIILPKRIDNSLNEFLKSKGNVKITIPKIGEKKNLLELVLKNIEATFFSDLEKLKDLKNKLKLEEIPNVIECFDISHLSGTSTVGSMVQFRLGKKDKTNYRRFKIRSVIGIDDTAGIREVVRRRYYRLIKENSNFPNLIIIDGGKGQLNSAIEELKKLNLKIPIISIAKKFEEVYLPNLSDPINLDKKSKALNFIREVRDEAHRFAINYNKFLRKENLLGK